MPLTPKGELAWKQVNSWEEPYGGGQVVNIPGDPGGVTKWGFAQNYNTDIDVLSLDEESAKERFKARYWDPVKGDLFPTDLAIALVDGAFHQGVGAAVRVLQKTLKIKEDGVVGSDTLAAVARGNPKNLLISFLGRRIEYYASLSTAFKIGFYNRIVNLALCLGRLI